jgi:hypothetical protein
MRHRFGCALVILLSGSLCSCLNGQRYLDVQIERDGKVVLETGYGVSDALDAADMWQSLQGESFKSVSTVSPEADDPQQAILKGKIRIVIHHVNNEIASAKVDELRLVRAAGSSDRWQLAPGEVKRTARAAGL